MVKTSLICLSGMQGMENMLHMARLNFPLKLRKTNIEPEGRPFKEDSSLQGAVSGSISVFRSALYYTLLYSTLLCSTLLYSTILCYIISYHTIPYDTIRYYTVLYSTLLYYILTIQLRRCSQGLCSSSTAGDCTGEVGMGTSCKAVVWLSEVGVGLQSTSNISIV